MINNNEKILELKEAIIKVVAFFDLFDYPLTLNEIWQNMSVKRELFEVMAALEEMIKSPLTPPTKAGAIEKQNGFYFLAGRSAIIAERQRRYNFADRKFKRAMLASKIFKFIPWIKMIAVGNLLGAHNLKDSSDIDFFIITEDKRIWLTRFFCASITKLLGLRPRVDNSRDKICLSFYVSERAMNLSGLMLKNYPAAVSEEEQISLDSRLRGNDKKGYGNDIYFIYWLAGLTPIYDIGGVYEKLMAANSWLKNYLPNWPALTEAPAGKQPGPWSKRRDVGGSLPRFYRDVIDLFIGGLEPQFKTLQLKLLPPQLKEMMYHDSRVVINDSILKLHANDRREEYREKYLSKIGQLR
ncbi:MAG: hypothetical protein WCV70_04025 [Patescibacteria group bacterium]|jgi:hypothetical protein